MVEVERNYFVSFFEVFSCFNDYDCVHFFNGLVRVLVHEKSHQNVSVPLIEFKDLKY